MKEDMRNPRSLRNNRNRVRKDGTYRPKVLTGEELRLQFWLNFTYN